MTERLRRERGNPAVEFLVADLSVQAQMRRLTGEEVKRQPEVEGVTGGYFAKKQPLASSSASHNEADAGRLWPIGAVMSGLSGAPASAAQAGQPGGDVQ